MRKRIPPHPGWPPHLAQYRLDDWAHEAAPRLAWALARWDHWQQHREDLPQVSPIDLLRERRSARLAAP